MKTIYFLGGPMGVGKSTVGRVLNQKLPKSVLLDGDWCWCMDPFQVCDETKAMVMDNICYTLNHFLACSVIENVVFCWVLDQPELYGQLYARLNLGACRVVARSLICSEASLRRRLQKDIDQGLRTPDIVERSISRLPNYCRLDVPLLDTTGRSPEAVAGEIAGETAGR